MKRKKNLLKLKLLFNQNYPKQKSIGMDRLLLKVNHFMIWDYV